MRTIVIDTNVLLADPTVLTSYPEAEMLIPETVLSELDKLKTSRVDPDLRFRGREVSRLLFDLSEQGNLVEGVALSEGGRLRVAPLLGDTVLPESLSVRNADDRILAVALQESRERPNEVFLMTNDLNMLLKAQTLGVQVLRHGDGVESSFGRRYIIRPFQRYRIPLTILAISLAVFAAIIFLVVAFQPKSPTSVQQINVPVDLRNSLTPEQQRVLQALTDLQQNPNDAQSLLAAANALYDAQQYQSSVRYFQGYLRQRPNDLDAKTDLGSAYFNIGKTDEGIRITTDVLEANPNHVNANFNLAIMYWRGKGDYQASLRRFERVLALTKNSTDPKQHEANQLAQNNIKALKAEATQRGIKLRSGGVQ